MINKLQAPLSDTDIELRVGRAGKSNNRAWAILLAYKTSRVDVARLNEVCGLAWTVDYHYDSKGLLVCRIGIRDDSGEWIFREDVGTESQTEAEKGSYSDALKRAGFRWGIGLELYSMPLLFCYLEDNEYSEKNGKVYPKITGWSLMYDYQNSRVIVLDKNGNERVSSFWNFLKGVKNG